MAVGGFSKVATAQRAQKTAKTTHAVSCDRWALTWIQLLSFKPPSTYTRLVVPLLYPFYLEVYLDIVFLGFASSSSAFLIML